MSESEWLLASGLAVGAFLLLRPKQVLVTTTDPNAGMNTLPTSIDPVVLPSALGASSVSATASVQSGAVILDSSSTQAAMGAAIAQAKAPAPAMPASQPATLNPSGQTAPIVIHGGSVLSAF